VVGWLGGAVVCKYVGFIGVEPQQYFNGVTMFMTTTKLVDGFVKAEIFGFVIVLIACNTGLRTKGGPREIGFAVTNSVVLSLVAILVLDYFITKIQG
jgi:phospholipid/cholesterol/gamma-HCH transport system permease protein